MDAWSPPSSDRPPPTGIIHGIAPKTIPRGESSSQIQMITRTLGPSPRPRVCLPIFTQYSGTVSARQVLRNETVCFEFRCTLQLAYGGRTRKAVARGQTKMASDFIRTNDSHWDSAVLWCRPTFVRRGESYDGGNGRSGFCCVGLLSTRIAHADGAPRRPEQNFYDSDFRSQS